MTSAISSLLVSEDEVASEAITQSLQGLVQIGKTSGNPLPTAMFERLDRTTKILVFLLALRAAAVLGVNQKTSATAEDLAAIVGCDVKSVREYASRLKRRFLARTGEGYEVPTAKIRAISEEINTRRNSNEAR
jgi:hypothetical protein